MYRWRSNPWKQEENASCFIFVTRLLYSSKVACFASYPWVYIETTFEIEHRSFEK